MDGVKAPRIERKEETPVVVDGRGQGSWDREKKETPVVVDGRSQGSWDREKGRDIGSS